MSNKDSSLVEADDFIESTTKLKEFIKNNKIAPDLYLEWFTEVNIQLAKVERQLIALISGIVKDQSQSVDYLARNYLAQLKELSKVGNDLPWEKNDGK